MSGIIGLKHWFIHWKARKSDGLQVRSCIAAGQANEFPVTSHLFLVSHSTGFILRLTHLMTSRPQSPWQSLLATRPGGYLQTNPCGQGGEDNRSTGWCEPPKVLPPPPPPQNCSRLTPPNCRAGRHGTLLGKGGKAMHGGGGRGMRSSCPDLSWPLSPGSVI